MPEITSRLSTALAWPEKRGGEDPQNHAMRLLALATIVIAGSTPASAQDVVLRGGNVVDVQTGEVTVASVLIRDGVIQAVSSRLAPPAGATIIEAADRWIIPGLVELHSHTTDSASLRRALALGVTSTLTVYTGTEAIPPQWEGPSHLPDNPVPRMYLIGGRFRIPRADRASPVVLGPTTPAESADHLDAYRAQGVSRIKIWLDDGTVQFDTPSATFDDRTLAALVANAKARGMRVYFHALTGALYRRAIAVRPTWIIHPMVTDVLTVDDVEAIQAAGLGWTTVMSIVLWNRDPRRYARMVLADPRLVASLSDETRQRYQADAQLAENPHVSSRPRIVRLGDEYLAIIRRNTQLAVSSGLTVAVGSDRPVGHGTHVEIELLREAGLDATTILKAATIGGAQALDVATEFGTVEAQKVADLVLLTSNPLDDITNLRDVEMVIKGGRIWHATDLMER